MGANHQVTTEVYSKTKKQIKCNTCVQVASASSIHIFVKAEG